MRYTFRCGAAALLGLAGFGCTLTVDSQGQIVREEKRFTVTGPADLRLTTFDGSIQIEAWDRPDIRIEVEKRGATREAIENIGVRAEQHGDTIEFEVKRPSEESFRGIGIHRGATARLIVSVPARSNIRARSGDGSIRLEGIDGAIELRTDDGSIRITKASGEITLTSGDGSINVADVEGRLDVNTGDGGVNVTGKLAGLKLHTGDGTIVYRADPGTVMGEDWELTTGDGGVSVYLPDEFNADIDAQTGDGRIHNELSQMAEASPDSDRRVFRGQLGAGGKRLKIRTEDGSIRIRRD